MRMKKLNLTQLQSVISELKNLINSTIDVELLDEENDDKLSAINNNLFVMDRAVTKAIKDSQEIDIKAMIKRCNHIEKEYKSILLSIIEPNEPEAYFPVSTLKSR